MPVNSIDLSPCISLQSIGANAFYDNNFSSFVLPTPQISGQTFEHWEDAASNYYSGGTTVSDLTSAYTAVFSTDSLLELNFDVSITDAACYGFPGIIHVDISGGLGGSYGLSGQTAEALTDGNSYVVMVYDYNIQEFVYEAVLADAENAVDIFVEPGYYQLIVEDAANHDVNEMVVVMQPEPLVSVVNVNNPLCAEDTAAFVWLDVFGGTPPYMYSLFRDDMLLYDSEFNSFDVSTEGFYEIWVYDANGCGEVQSVFIEKNDSIAFTVKDVSCYFDSLATAKITVENALPGQTFQVYYYYYENGNYVGYGISENFETEINISGLLYDDVITDRYYEFHVMNDMGCYSGGISRAFNSASEPLSLDINQLNVSEVNADIQILIAGGLAPYRMEIDGVETEEYYQTISTGWHTFYVIDAHECVVTDSLFIDPNTSCPQYFHPVWEGNGVYDPMNIYITEAKIDNLDLEPGDQIGVFDAGLCVGQGAVTETITQQSILSIVLSADDGTGNGYTPGNPVVYKIWKCDSGEEISTVEAACFTNQMVPVACSGFQSGATSFVQLNGNTKVNFATDFQPGWNIFSLPVLPDSADMEFTFSDLITENSLLKIQDETGAAMEDLGTFGGWQNDIGEIRLSEGYKIKVSKYDSLYCSGILPAYPFGIHLNAGWNLVGFPSISYVDALEVFQQLIDRGTLIKVQNEQGKSIEDIGIYGGWQNFIGNIWAGEGFKVKVAGRDTLWIYKSYPKSLNIVAATVPTQHFKTGITGNGVDHMNFNVVELPVNALNPGDEIAVYDGTTCVGAAVVTEDHLSRQLVSIAASAADDSGQPGFFEGNNYGLRLWNAALNREARIETDHLSGPLQFRKHESVMVSLGKAIPTSIEDVNAKQNLKMRCYPNPFNEVLMVDMTLTGNSEVTVKVLSQTGQVVRTLLSGKKLDGGQHLLNWDGQNDGGMKVANGMYLIRIVVNNSVHTEKVTFSY